MACSGKNHLTQLLMGQGIGSLLVSTTTRAPRDGEVDGVDYYFVDKATFTGMIKSGQLIEHVQIDQEFYGVSYQALAADLGPYPIAIVDPIGHKALMQHLDEQQKSYTSVFLGCPLQLQLSRLKERFYKQENPDIETFRKRMDSIDKERSFWDSFVDYHLSFGVFDKKNQNFVVSAIAGRLKFQATERVKVG
jgi:guanylate kinase